MSNLASQESKFGDQLVVERDRALVKIVLNWPKALNALNDNMKTAIAEALATVADGPETYAIAIRSTDARAFCAGGDIRELAGTAKLDLAMARGSLAVEYALNWQLECFHKPSIALMDGMVMGSGAGISQYTTHRVAGPNYSFAMPETAVGFFPDVGIAKTLADLPDNIGVYLALTGRRIDRNDALALGLVTHCIAAQSFDFICEGLADAQPIDPLVEGLAESPGPSSIEAQRATIAATFCARSVEAIIGNLELVGRGIEGSQEWAQSVLDDLARRSPTSLKVSLRHVLECRNKSLRETLMTDYRLGCRFLDGPDFYEGVRAVLVDKDNEPRWQPGALAEVDDATVAAYFAPMDGDELDLQIPDDV